MEHPGRHYDFFQGEVLLFDKDRTWTSFDLVQKVRNRLCRKLHIKKLKVGHAGTLDPLASGLMILCTGNATKQIETLQLEKKEYVATLKLGATTPSFDLETEEDNIFGYSHISKEMFIEKLDSFIGNILQVPPVFSAIKVDGRRAYQFARKGEEVDLKPKPVVIDSIELVKFNLPEVEIKVVCGKGTYIRSLARDLGESLGCGAYLTGLRRTRIGSFSVEEAISVDYFLENIDLFVTN